MKHAFSDTEFPKIKLNAKADSDSEFMEFVYSDNGAWKEPDSETFGTQLIEALAEQLEGSYELNTSETGSTYTFHFKKLD